ncbi:hypothetical protein KX928_23380 [Roseobacter sp. YSTF-M11]|uniref:Uncharacterized protein n=1 Tax=Roseobacter insulae TaxID=2859783 RepID=A0A9X1K4L9_9RHOB|nr:hypothetical protein [Roseobacter insulae]MBW4710743.1 hypothetical protein [Roseobacter insulae]
MISLAFIAAWVFTLRYPKTPFAGWVVTITSRIINSCTPGEWGTAEYTLSVHAAIEARQGHPVWVAVERAIDLAFLAIAQEQNHCRGVLVEDDRQAGRLRDLVKDFRDWGLI